MKRILFFLYGLVAYASFLATILYAAGFVGNLRLHLGDGLVFVPKSMDLGGEGASLTHALLVDALLLGVFALQHSGMARRGFKERWTRIVPKPIERSTYVIASSAALALLFAYWRPIGGAVWSTQHHAVTTLLAVVSGLGWLIALASTFHLHHFELFGLRQVHAALRGRELPSASFRTPGLYRFVRHPLYLGFLIAFWATPVMTLGHLVFAAGTTLYILVAIQLEERDLVRELGPRYERYREQVSMLVPLPKRHELPVQAELEP
jgi:protein-S-isoprenylcysteine O-methyltransferase Ste14